MFNADPEVQIKKSGRDMIMLEPFVWRGINVPAGSHINGASIPRLLWSIVGSPFGGNYVWASIVHDYLCVNHIYKSTVTHDIFYYAMIDAGVNKYKAWIMWLGVRLFGPRWSEGKDSFEVE